MADKDFKTIEEQIEILRSRGLSIEDEAEAKDFLLRNNYYRVSGYSLTLRKNDVFAKSATFQNIENIYNFDHEFRHIILHHIETIEVQMKSIYAYEFTKVYGPLGYLDTANFSNQAKHKEIIDKANQQKRQRLAHEAYLKHFINDLHQEIPLWAYVDLLTISDISFLYSISERPIKETIAHRFGLTMNRGPEILGQYMHSMTIIRNLCAHGSRIYNRLFEQKPSLNRKEQTLLIRREDGTMDNSHFFGFFLVMRRLLPAENFAEMKEAVIALTEKYPFIYGAAGVHPSSTAELDEEKFAELRVLAQSGKIVAIGEIGLDYYWEEPDHETQKKWFHRQLNLARELKLPVIIHSRDAAKDTLDIMKEEHSGEIGGVIHCFSYGKEMAAEYLKMGFYLGIGGVLTFKNAKKLLEVAEMAPLDRLVLETDCPYLAPVPNRGKRNSSLNLPYVAEKLAEIKKCTPEEIVRATEENARRLYRLM